MKLVVASFQCESNSKAKLHPQKSDFEYFRGEDIFKKLVVKEIFEKEGFEVIPSVYAVALPSATVELDTYHYYVNQILYDNGFVDLMVKISFHTKFSKCSIAYQRDFCKEFPLIE